MTPSNNTRANDLKEIRPGDYSGRYVHWGVREHGMAAAMNGIAVHGGLIPYGGTFLTFSDYCRPSIRLSAFMGAGVVYVMTHDSIGLGEDGPTHQPVEHLAALRAIPGLYVYRPADPIRGPYSYLPNYSRTLSQTAPDAGPHAPRRISRSPNGRPTL